MQHCVDSLSVTEVVAGGYERRVFTTREQNKNTNPANMGRLVSERLEISQPTMSFPSLTVSLPVYAYGLMLPPAPPRILVGGEQLP